LAGIYIHIPFCRKACRYCDFYFTVSFQQKKEVVLCILREIENRKDELGGELIETIYFGGGTPSVLDPQEIIDILKTIYRNHKVDTTAEISFEANPDDLKPEYLKILKENGINRLSIGIQSFSQKDLELMRRSHTVSQSYEVIDNSIKSGFKNINIDLIYCIPGQDIHTWEKNINIASGSGIQHISAYHLTFEKGTVFNHWRKKGKLLPIHENESIQQFELLIDKTSSAGFDHYEISNFALEGFHSKHNNNYWKQVNYIGVGPSAHSYNGISRRWNISNNSRYIQSIKNDQKNYYESENLSRTDLYNEYILKSLRTKAGINLTEIALKFGQSYKEFASKEASKFIKAGKLVKDNETINLTRGGIFIADYIISGLFKV